MNTAGACHVTEVTPSDAYEILKDPDAVLVDVRTNAEWALVGTPDLGALDKQVMLVEWLGFPDMATNPDFAGQLFSRFGENFPEKILFICRSGARSRDAATHVTNTLGEIGRTAECINVAEGFEGDLDQERHRGKLNGWKKRNLPWRQS